MSPNLRKPSVAARTMTGGNNLPNTLADVDQADRFGIIGYELNTLMEAPILDDRRRVFELLAWF
jgi:hypothetical protein